MHDPRIDQPYVVERWPKPHLSSPSSPRARAVAECCLALVTVAAVFSFTRVFDSRSFVVPVAATALVAHACTAVLRRRQWRAALALPMCGLVVALTSAAGSLRSTIRDDFSEAWMIVNNERAPVPPTRVLVLAASLLIGLAVVAADSLAFRRRALFGALLPAVLVFGLSAMYGADRHRLVSIGLLVGSAVCFALTHRLAFFDRGAGWMIDRSLSPHRYLMSGLAVASCAVLIALAVGPSLPGAGNDALVAWRDIGNGWAQQDDGVALAPLVSVRAQLIEQSEREVFTVQSTQPDYWRLTALDVFDGVEWSAGASAGLSVTLPLTGADNALRQVVTIDALRGTWLPAASTAVAVAFENGTVTFDPATATLQTDDQLGKGDTYTVWSSASADTAAPTSAALSVPRAVRPQLLSLANQIVRDAGAVTPIDKARALEAYFLDNFTYDLHVAAGSSITDITSFLERRSGYCEQFAATFAAMARVLGIPSRVAIGYRVGTYDERQGEFTVTGRDAHAWPELYFTGRGWVRFEPTPGTTGAPASEAPASTAAETPAAAAVAETPTTTAPAPATTVDEPATDAATGGEPITTRGGAGFGLVALIAALALLISALPVAIEGLRRRRSRRRAQRDPRELIVWMWRDALRWFRIAGADVRANETPLEVASRAAPSIAAATAPLSNLAQLVTAACYSEAGPARADLDVATGEVESIRRCAKTQLGRSWRLRWYVAQVRGVVVHTGSASSSVAQASSTS